MLTHSDRGVGVDLEIVEPRSSAFLRTWFTEVEQRLAKDSTLRQTLIWTVKEAVLKSLGLGLSLGTKCVEVIAISARTCRVRVHATSSKQQVNVRWQRIQNDYLLAVAPAP